MLNKCDDYLKKNAGAYALASIGTKKGTSHMIISIRYFSSFSKWSIILNIIFHSIYLLIYSSFLSFISGFIYLFFIDIFIYLLIFIVVQVQLSPFSPWLLPPPQPSHLPSSIYETTTCVKLLNNLIHLFPLKFWRNSSSKWIGLVVPQLKEGFLKILTQGHFFIAFRERKGERKTLMWERSTD